VGRTEPETRIILEVLAYAKLNLALEVLGRRSDGYHEVSTILQTIDLADRLTFHPATDLSLQCDDPALNGQDNLVWQAAEILAKSRNIQPRVHIHLEKHIPVAMGLGGGSSDAAATLVALDQLWQLNLSEDELSECAASLGSDVAFFLSGGTALASGRGELITPIHPLPSSPVTLICPSATIPEKTARMFSRLTSEHHSNGERTSRLAEILESDGYVEDMQYNVFEQVAFQEFEELDVLRQQIRASTGAEVHLSGAGPALYCLPSSEDDFQRVSHALQPYGARVYLVHTISPGTEPGTSI
jgi:4-diphosphocytidyl-2-C-methyl-D-erythritol kinase